MRITNNMMVANTVWNINKNMERLNAASEKVATQSNIQVPSDDPIVATKAITLRSCVADVEQYDKNVDAAVSWQDVTDTAIDGLVDVVQQTQELVTQASSDTLTDDELADIASEIEELQQTAVDYLNTSYAGRYVFGGYSTSEPPYAIETVEINGTEVSMVTFKGQYLSTTVDSSINAADVTNFFTTSSVGVYEDSGVDQTISYNVGFGTDLEVNVEGQDVTGSGAGNFFDTFAKILYCMNDGSYSTYNTMTSAVTTTTIDQTADATNGTYKMDNLLDDLETNLNTILTAQTSLGAKSSYAQSIQSRLATDNETYTTLMSANEDADIAVAETDLTTAQSVYEASLTVASVVMSKTLVDYLA